jgi:predicted ABC-type ATPase
MSTPPTLCLFAGSNGAGKADVRRRFARSQTNLIQLYGPLADTWQVWDRNDRLQRRFEAAVSPAKDPGNLFGFRLNETALQDTSCVYLIGGFGE